MAKKKNLTERAPIKTYKLGRACLYCGEPIEDQARATKKHCTRWMDNEGVIHDCKRRKHHLIHKQEDDLLLDFSAKQREIKKQIEKILAAHGDVVSTEVLNAYNVTLSDNIKFSYHSNLATSEFIGYQIITNPKQNNHQIQKL